LQGLADFRPRERLHPAFPAEHVVERVRVRHQIFDTRRPHGESRGKDLAILTVGNDCHVSPLCQTPRDAAAIASLIDMTFGLPLTCGPLPGAPLIDLFAAGRAGASRSGLADAAGVVTGDGLIRSAMS